MPQIIDHPDEVGHAPNTASSKENITWHPVTPSNVTTIPENVERDTALGTDQRSTSPPKEVPKEEATHRQGGWRGWLPSWGHNISTEPPEHVFVDTHEKERWDHWKEGDEKLHAEIHGLQGHGESTTAPHHDRMIPFDPHNKEWGVYDNPLATPAVSSASSPSAPGRSFFRRRRPSEEPTPEHTTSIGQDIATKASEIKEAAKETAKEMTTTPEQTEQPKTKTDTVYHFKDSLIARFKRQAPVPDDPSSMTIDSPGTTVTRRHSSTIPDWLPPSSTDVEVQRRMSDAVRNVTTDASNTTIPTSDHHTRFHEQVAQSTWLWQRGSPIEKSSFRRVMPEDISMTSENLVDILDEVNAGV
jgi:hypothetical protein